MNLADIAEHISQIALRPHARQGPQGMELWNPCISISAPLCHNGVGQI